MIRRIPRAHWRRRLALFGLWTVLGVFFATQLYAIELVLFKTRIEWRWAFAVALMHWYIWAFLAFLVLRLADRFPMDGGRFARNGVLHLGLATVVSAVQIVVYVVVLYQFKRIGHPDVRITWETLRFNFATDWHWNVLIYFAIAGAGHLRRLSRIAGERAQAASALESRLAEARLQALRAQVHPHFLFNTLNAISSLVYEDPPRAVRCVARLSDLLRTSLEATATHEVPLAQEIAGLQNYLDIMETRFAERLTVEMDVREETGPALVPSLILQPVVENAVLYGVVPRTSGGRIAVRSLRRGEALHLEVEDDGPGLPADTPPENGVGLSSVCARLHLLYGDAQDCRFERGAWGGLLVRLILPFHTEPLPATRPTQAQAPTDAARADR